MLSIFVRYGLLMALVSLTAAAQEPASYRAGAERFVLQMVRDRGFDRRELTALMEQATYSREIVAAMRRPYEARPWYKYRPIFLTDERIRKGVAFWHRNRALLKRARTAYGVPPWIIAAIIGVETDYGGNLGRHRVIDALSTLGFSYPKRADFFLEELTEFLLLVREEALDALAVKGSYAGAMGLPQFIPSSYRAYAVDFDGDGQRDLQGSTADAIGSVGNYLARHGWRTGEPVAFAAKAGRKAPTGLTPAGKQPVRPTIHRDRLATAGILVDGSLPESARVTLIRLMAPKPEYWLGLENFYVITRYNHSNLYAMAVYQLGREIQARYVAGDERPVTPSRYRDQ